MPLIRLSAFLCSVLLLQACNPFLSEQESMFDRYHNRLSNVLDANDNGDTPPATDPIELPTARELHIEIPRITLGLLESYQLRQCGLFQLLAEKNSSLGKVQDQFRNLSYQLQLLNTLSNCLNSDELSQEDIEKLNHINQIKWDHLPLHLSNLMLTSPTMRKQFTESQWMSYEVMTYIYPVRQALDELEQISTLKDESYHAELIPSQIEDHQEILEKSRLIGHLYYSMVRATQWLDISTHMLEQNDHKLICGSNRDTTRLRYIRNVFQTYYAGEVQPYLADLNRTYGELEQGIQFFESQLSHRQQSSTDNNENHDSDNTTRYNIKQSHDDFRDAIIKHAKYWQGLFKRCGVKVGR